MDSMRRKRKDAAFVARLREAFEYSTMANAARKLEMKHATVRNYFHGRLPHAEALIRIGEKTGVSLNWLLFGLGEKYAADIAPQSLGTFLEVRIEEVIDKKIEEMVERKLEEVIDRKLKSYDEREALRARKKS
jgi:hypothetical protein